MPSWPVGNSVLIITIPHLQSPRLPGSLRSARAKLPKPGHAIGTAGEFDGKNPGALICQPSEDSNPEGLE
jgi:hypothetical protein